MAVTTPTDARRTSVDQIFDALYADIAALRLKPGDKISEAETAARFGVSRQPVRDAFSRLENLDLLLIRPQRATEVKRFSSREIEKSRFVRSSVEAQVLRLASEHCDADGAAELAACLEAQSRVIKDDDYDAFGALDYAFHKTLCQIARVEFAFEVIQAEKAKVDRLCRLSLSREARMPLLLSDHTAIAEAVRDGQAERAVEAGMIHLGRLDSTIQSISATNANYFEPDQT